MFAGRFHVQVAVVDGVALEGDVSAAIAIETVGIVGFALAGIGNSADVVNRIAADLAVPGLVGTTRTHALKANGIDSDVVIVMHDVVRDGEVGHISIYVHRFALAGFQVVDLVAADGQIRNGKARAPIYGDAKCIPILLRCGRDVVHQIVEQLEAAAGTSDPDASRSKGGLVGREIADLKSAHRDVAL